jgi:hypothetical protein
MELKEVKNGTLVQVKNTPTVSPSLRGRRGHITGSDVTLKLPIFVTLLLDHHETDFRAEELEVV